MNMVEPKFYRKKPVVIEAMRFDGSVQAVNMLEAWSDRTVRYSDDDGVFIDTLEGRLTVSDGDWVIKGVSGEFYPCKPDIFDATYEAVSPDGKSTERSE